MAVNVKVETKISGLKSIKMGQARSPGLRAAHWKDARSDWRVFSIYAVGEWPNRRVWETSPLPRAGKRIPHAGKRPPRSAQERSPLSGAAVAAAWGSGRRRAWKRSPPRGLGSPPRVAAVAAARGSGRRRAG
jgi:hypothetical protein